MFPKEPQLRESWEKTYRESKFYSDEAPSMFGTL